MKYILLLMSCHIFSQNIVVGDSLVSIGKYNEAIKTYNLASENIKNYKIAKVFEAKGNKNEALKYYKNYLLKDSTSISINFDYGLLLIDVSKYEEALVVFDKLVKNQNQNPIFLYYLGLANEKQRESHRSPFNPYELKLAATLQHLGELMLPIWKLCGELQKSRKHFKVRWRIARAITRKAGVAVFDIGRV